MKHECKDRKREGRGQILPRFLHPEILRSFGRFVIRAKVNLTAFSIQRWHVKRKAFTLRVDRKGMYLSGK